MEVNPLTYELLEGAAYLCLKRAALTDMDQFPPGSGTAICRYFRARRRRFKKACEKMRAGKFLLSELGLLSEDCAWAKAQAHHAKEPAEWSRRFLSAEEILKQEEAI